MLSVDSLAFGLNNAKTADKLRKFEKKYNFRSLSTILQEVMFISWNNPERGVFYY